MKQIVLFVSVLFSVLLLNSAVAQTTNGISTGVPDPRILSLHAKVDDLFQHGEVSRAYFIYRNELVPLGDKYAQYMVGYMHLAGMAVEQDKVAASAWYRLAAERGTPEFMQLRDQLLLELTADERSRSDALYLDLRREYHDLAVLLSSVKRHKRALRNRGMAGPGVSGTTVSSRTTKKLSPRYYEQLERELEHQLKMLAEIGNFPGMETDPDAVDLDEVERRVMARINELSD